MRTLSKNFYDDEIRGIVEVDGKRVLYLKTNVRRRRYIEEMYEDPNEIDSQINKELIQRELREKFYKEILGLEDYKEEK